MNKGSLVLQGKPVAVRVATDKIQDLKEKKNTQNWKACVFPWELNSFPRFKDFFNEISGDILNVFKYCMIKYSNNQKKAQSSESGFSK